MKWMVSGAFIIVAGAVQGAVINPTLARLSRTTGVVSVSSFSSLSVPKFVAPAADPDTGPYCFLNKTTNSMTTSTYVSSGFVVTDKACGANCDLAGCTQYRLNSYSPLGYSQLSTCLVAEAFHFSLEGSRKEKWCPWYDLQKSVFVFRGKTYNIQWYWLGWGTSSDCMEAILCGPSSYFFDSSQGKSLAWCQPVPRGYFSLQCVNDIHPCTNNPAGITGGSMDLAYWTSHGYGSPSGCGIRLVCAAVLRGYDVSPCLSQMWSIAFSVQLFPPFIVGNSELILGSFRLFSIGVVIVSPSSVELKFFHSMWTVTRSSSRVTISDYPVAWFPGESKTIVVSFASQILRVYINTVKIGQVGLSESSASIGSLLSGDIPAILTPDTLHIGNVFVSNTDDLVGASSSDSPYTYKGGIDFSILSDSVEVSDQEFTTTTTTSSTVFQFAPSLAYTTSISSSTVSVPTTFPSSSCSSITVPATSSLTTISQNTSPPTEIHLALVTPSTSISDGGIAGIIIGIILFIACIACVAKKLRRSRRKKLSSLVMNSWSPPSLFEEPSELMVLPQPAAPEFAVNEPTFVFYFYFALFTAYFMNFFFESTICPTSRKVPRPLPGSTCLFPPGRTQGRKSTLRKA